MRRMRLARWTLGCILAGMTPAVEGEIEDIVAEPVFSGLEDPVWVTSEPDGALSITLLPGIVLRRRGGGLDPQPVLDIQHRVRGAGGGLHSVVFHPTEPWLFAHFSEAESFDLVVSRFDLAGDPPRAQLASEAELLRIPKASPLHYGGQLAFGPDGYLWLSTGDSSRPGMADPQCAAQATTSLEGKVLRLDVDTGSLAAPYYAIPADNPFAAGGGAPEVWGYGLRNPWRFSFDRETGDLWLSDVGEAQREEVSFLAAGTGAGTNFGWKVMEGTYCFSDLSGCDAGLPGCGDAGYQPPLLEYGHAEGRCAIVGGFVYRGRLVPALHGRYVYGDFCSGELWAAAAGGGVESLPIRLPGMSTLGEDAEGELWLAADLLPPLGSATDQVYRLRDTSLPAAGLVELEIRTIEVSEGDGMVEVGVVRVGGTEGAVRVLVSAVGGTATAGVDFVAEPAEIAWEDGEVGRRTFPVALIDDGAFEGVESLAITLDLIAGEGILGARDRGTVSVSDDDVCMSDATHLCLNRGRFRASVSFTTYEGLEGQGQAVALGEDAGFFWFFSAGNPELVIKVLDACQLPGFNSFWVFAAGLTDLRTNLRVIDTATGEERLYSRALGAPYDPVRDTAAFDTCP